MAGVQSRGLQQMGIGGGGGQQGGQQQLSQQQLTKKVKKRILKRLKLAICLMFDQCPRVIKKQTEEKVSRLY